MLATLPNRWGLGITSMGVQSDDPQKIFSGGTTTPGAAPAATAPVINSNAAAALTTAGYKGVVCQPVLIANLGGTWWENQCTASNSNSVMTADLVGRMSPAELAAQLAQEAPYAGISDAALNLKLQALTHAPTDQTSNPNQNNVDYAKWVNSLPSGVPVNGATPEQMKQTAAYVSGNGGPASGGAVAPDWFGTLQKQLASLTNQVTGKASPPAAGSSGSTFDISTLTSTAPGDELISGVPNLYLLLAAGAALFLFMKGSR